MIEQPSHRFRSSSISPLLVLLVLMVCSGLGLSHAQQPSQTGGTQANEKPAGQEFAPRGQRMARDQIFRLAQVLLQDARNEHGLQDEHQRHV